MRLAAETDFLLPDDGCQALAILELASGRCDTALEHFAHSVSVGTGPGLFGRPGGGDVVEAYVRAGLPVPAALRQHVQAITDVAPGEVTPAIAALAWRCRAMADDDELAFHRALELYEGLDLPLDEARTRLAFGERLRRRGFRSRARPYLVQALETFEQTGCTLWARRAREELTAAGQTRSPGTSAIGELTPQELQVAITVADGATNREVASTLFLSVKTVEMHLSRVYRKLGVRSRTELAVAIRRT
jgi:DNA-binding CsgD family transcriptional regulator